MPESEKPDELVVHHRGLSRLLKGYRAGIAHCAIAAGSVLIINVALLVSATSRYGSVDGVGTLLEGKCETVKPLNTVLHLIINILSTLVLAGSNYCMQCLTAPSRQEVDVAHAKGDWMEIGLPSIRNLRRVSKLKAGLWFCLAFSSLPLHLFYNSAIFTTIGVSDYNVFVANSTFVDTLLNRQGPLSLSTPSLNETHSLDSSGDSDADGLLPQPRCAGTSNHLEKLQLSKNFRKLNNEECISAYIRRLQSRHRNLFLVSDVQNVTELCTNPVSPTSSFRGRKGGQSSDKPVDQLRWLCDFVSKDKVCLTSAPRSITANAPTWHPLDTSVSYCMSEEYQPTCKLQFSVVLLEVVIVFNALKVCFMLLTYKALGKRPLLSLGDAIASFLENEDPVTKGRCILERKDFDGEKATVKFPREYKRKRRLWFTSASSMRWLMMGGLLLEYYTFLLMIFGDSFGRNSVSFLWALGWTPTDSASLSESLPKMNSLIPSAVIANLAQPLLSINYMAQNGLLTAMLQGKEWDDFTTRKKGLRVSSSPAGKQTISRYLQLPTRFALPLMILSGVLHYIFSQGIYAVHVQSYDEKGRQYGNVTASVGFSLMAIVVANIGLVVSVIIIVGIGLQRYNTYIPHLGSCSMVLSAACHPDQASKDRGNIQFEDLHWGVTETIDNVGHCSFTSGPVELPVVGQRYAGQPEK